MRKVTKEIENPMLPCTKPTHPRRIFGMAALFIDILIFEENIKNVEKLITL
jgi:hypothetical protein